MYPFLFQYGRLDFCKQTMEFYVATDIVVVPTLMSLFLA